MAAAGRGSWGRPQPVLVSGKIQSEFTKMGTEGDEEIRALKGRRKISFPFLIFNFFFFHIWFNISIRFSNILLNLNANQDFGGIEQTSSAETPVCGLSNPN